MTMATKLSEARKLIERGWCQNAMARGKTGRRVDPEGRAAVCWCTLGALHAVGANYKDVAPLRKAIGGPYLTVWNDADGRTQSEVIEAFKRAEQLARDGAE